MGMNVDGGRRTQVMDALQAIIAERGLDGVSIREVASSAGVSIGTVQYYCRSKEEMLLLSFEQIVDRIGARAAAAVDEGGTVGQALHRALLELLPLDHLRRTESLVYLAFAGKAAVTPSLAAVQHAKLDQLRTQCAAAFRRAQEIGEAPTDLDVDAEAATTAALIDGLLLHVLTDPEGLPPATAEAVLQAHLGRYLDVDGTGARRAQEISAQSSS